MTEPGPASRIGRYQLVSPIGAGGMGRVWVALDSAAPALRLVALKTTLGGSESGMTADFWAMLNDEAALASRINHPNVCATHELGHEGSVHFLVMEWSDGASLRDVLDASAGKRIEPELAAFIGASVAAGLHAAHELTDDAGQPLGVVHRDVSPQNVLVSMRGHVRLADFGVAKARGQQHRPTETGEVKGKLSYMAPEQVASKHLDRRADVFALGCVLYEAALGVRPFHGADALATMYKILEQEVVPPHSLDPTFPEQLERVVLKALAKDPNARFATAEDLRAALVDYLSTTGRFFADKHIAELLSGTLGDTLRERNRAIYKSADQLRRGETDPSRLDSPPPPSPTQTLTPEGGVERSVALVHARRPDAWQRRLLIAGSVAMAVAALFVVRNAWRVKPPSSSEEAARHAAAQPALPAALPALLASESAPSLPAASATVSEPAPAVTTRRPQRGARPSARPASPASAAPKQPAGAPKATAKTPRPIDHDNPFAKP